MQEVALAEGEVDDLTALNDLAGGGGGEVDDGSSVSHLDGLGLAADAELEINGLNLLDLKLKALRLGREAGHRGLQSCSVHG